jgi:hypothetical protein
VGPNPRAEPSANTHRLGKSWRGERVRVITDVTTSGFRPWWPADPSEPRGSALSTIDSTGNPVPGLTVPDLRGAGAGMPSYDDSVYKRLLRERIVFHGSQVEDSVANLLCAQILLLAAEDPDRDIYLYINSRVVLSPLAWRSTTPCSTSRAMWRRLRWGWRRRWVVPAQPVPRGDTPAARPDL